MRDDLLDAQAAVDWAVTQIPLFQSAFLEWSKDGPYHLVKEPDSDGSGSYAVIAHLRFPLPLTFNAWAGARLSARSVALSILSRHPWPSATVTIRAPTRIFQPSDPSRT